MIYFRNLKKIDINIACLIYYFDIYWYKLIFVWYKTMMIDSDWYNPTMHLIYAYIICHMFDIYWYKLTLFEIDWYNLHCYKHWYTVCSIDIYWYILIYWDIHWNQSVSPYISQRNSWYLLISVKEYIWYNWYCIKDFVLIYTDIP